MTTSYLIYDFETDGSDPRTCRPLQVAWQRFDLNLKPIDDPVSMYVTPAPDRLPHPKAIEITGISLAQCAGEGVSDADAFRRLHAEVSKPGTCSFGWNSRRFDNEILRFGFWRNFLPSYEHESRQGCDAWDAIDLARAACALRPDGLVWPTKEDGTPSFKLDMLAPANGFDHSDAHDAMADVNATAHIAKLLQTSSPKLWDFARSLNDTETVRSIVSDKPFVHVTSRIRAAEFCTAPFAVAARTPDRKNEVIAWNLRHDPTEAMDADEDTLRRRIFTRQDDLGDGETRFGVKKIKLNAAPFVAPMGVLGEHDAQRLGIDLSSVDRHYALLREHGAALGKRLITIHGDPLPPRTDPDDALYGGNFPSKADLAISRSIPDTAPPDLHAIERRFHDARFTGLLLHYIARNHGEFLNDMQRAAWTQRTHDRLLDPPSRDDLDWDDWCVKMAEAINAASPETRPVLETAHAHGLQVGAAVGLTRDVAPQEDPAGN